MSRLSIFAMLALAVLLCAAMSVQAQLDDSESEMYEIVGFDTYEVHDVLEGYASVDDFEAAAAEEEFAQFHEQQLPVLQRAPQFKQRPTITQRAYIPAMASETFMERAPSITQAPLHATLPTLLQRTELPHQKKEHRQAEFQRAFIPQMASSSTTERAKTLTQQALHEMRPTIVQATLMPQQTKELRPVQTQAAAIPQLESSQETENAAPITQKALHETLPTIVQEAPDSGKKHHEF